MAKINDCEDTIAAIATPFGEGAVGIVRLSGKEAISIADQIFLAKNRKSLSQLRTYALRYGWVVKDQATIEKNNLSLPDFRAQIVDEVVVSLMRSPYSYTREDVVEINAHGGAMALSSILELALEKGARLAQPGEFTKRAFLNGRLDLAQAEAVLDIIHAKSELALKSSLSQLSGEVSRCMADLRHDMLEVLAQMEAAIDFPEEPVGVIENRGLVTRLSPVAEKLRVLLDGSFRGKMIREGLNVVIYGKPNVGKSSLLNALLKQERAIVTPIAGTTRDTIEEFINIKGLAVRLIDTAGILESGDEIEKEAVARTKKSLEECDLVLFVLDAGAPLSEEDRMLARHIIDKKFLIVMNKCDGHRRMDLQDNKEFFFREALEISALTGMNLDQLEEAIFKSVFGTAAALGEGRVVTNMRHIGILKTSLEYLKLSLDSLQKGLSLEFAAFDLKKALDVLGELTGESFSEDVLNMIFSKFCIGK